MVAGAESCLEHFYVFLLVADEGAVGGVAEADLEVEGVFGVEEPVVEVGDGQELVVAPALPDVVGGTVLSDH